MGTELWPVHVWGIDLADIDAALAEEAAKVLVISAAVSDHGDVESAIDAEDLEADSVEIARQLQPHFDKCDSWHIAATLLLAPKIDAAMRAAGIEPPSRELEPSQCHQTFAATSSGQDLGFPHHDYSLFHTGDENTRPHGCREVAVGTVIAGYGMLRNPRLPLSVSDSFALRASHHSWVESD